MTDKWTMALFAISFIASRVCSAKLLDKYANKKYMESEMEKLGAWSTKIPVDPMKIVVGGRLRRIIPRSGGALSYLKLTTT